jgi:ATP-dependent DNA ligase
MALKTMIKSIQLICTVGRSNKEYNIFLEESGGLYVVNFTYGPRGNPRSSGTKTNSPVSLAEAEKEFEKLMRSKMSTGYVAQTGADISAPVPMACTDLAGRATGLYPLLLSEITPHEAQKLLRDRDYFAQEKMDGWRLLTQYKNGEFIASNRKSLSIGIASDVEQELKEFGYHTLDGELVSGVYYLFDILESDGRDLRDLSYRTRFENLQNLLSRQKFEKIKLVPSAFYESDKLKLWVECLHKEGVVFKKQTAPYTQGISCDYMKCKHWSDVSVQVIGINQKASIQVGIMDGGKIRSVGNVTIIGHQTPAVGDIVDVTYLYVGAKGNLYQPKYRGIRTDTICDDVSKLKFKSADSEEE